MKITLMANTGTQMSGVETVQLDQSVYDALHLGYNLFFQSGNAAVFVLHQTLDVLSRLATDVRSDSGAIVSSGVDPDFAVQELANVARVLAKHHAAIMEAGPDQDG